MKKMIVKVADSTGRVGAEHIIVKTDFQLFIDKLVRVLLIMFAAIGLCATAYFLSGVQ